MGDPKGHSALGASGAERWLNCAGSVELLKRLGKPTSDEEDFQVEGTAAHEIASICLEEGSDAWEKIGLTINGIEVTSEMTVAVQVYLDQCRKFIGEGRVHGIEHRFHRPDLHELYFGTSDFWSYNPVEAVLNVTDYKHGIGIPVDVVGNDQIRYYAYGLLDMFPDARLIQLWIVQPRGFHPDGPVRRWVITAEELCEWAESTLLSAMNEIEMNGDLQAGPWCRFCPAKLLCPVLTGMFGAAMRADIREAVNINDNTLGVQFQAVQGVKFYIKALEKEVFNRLNSGHEIEGIKLVNQKANRVWKEGAAEKIAAEAFADKVYTKPELLGPAEIEKLGADAKSFVKTWAYTPQKGLTVALADDKRPAIRVQKASETFAGAVANLEQADAVQ